MGTKTRFGRRVRGLRGERGVGLRKFAKVVGISPTYLSKIERGEFPPPAEDKVVAIADALGQDRDEFLALAGRVSTDLEAVILRNPRELGALLRAARELSSDEIGHLTQAARRIAAASPDERAQWEDRDFFRVGRLFRSRPRDGVPDGLPELPT